MSNYITDIQLSGVTYALSAQSSGGSPTVELTQAEYDALVSAGTVASDTYYIITDAQAGDLTNYYTKTETNTLLRGKQATLVSGTNIKTINNESILGSGNIDIQGSGVNVVQTTGTSTTDVMSQDAVTTQLNNKLASVVYRKQSWAGSGITSIDTSKNSSNYTTITFVGSINNKPILTGDDYTKVHNFSLVETSAITTSITSSSTDAQVPSAKAVYGIVGNIETLLSQI